MPTYELALLVRIMPREEIFSCLKRTATEIFDKGGFIRKISNVGKHSTPYRMTAEYGPHREANYFVVEFEAAPYHLVELRKAYDRDVDIVRQSIMKAERLPAGQCTLEDELKPPAYRKEVQDMIAAEVRKRNKKPFSFWRFNTGLDYYPFQR